MTTRIEDPIVIHTEAREPTPCPRCGIDFGFRLPILDWDHPCGPDRPSLRRLEKSRSIPSHIAPYHRSIINGCQECSSSDLKTAFREVDSRQNVLQEMETLLSSCLNSDQSSKSIFPCIFQKSIKIIDLVPLLNNVISCQLSREMCYESSDLVDSPGLVNLFAQAKRFQTLVQLLLLPYSGRIPGDPLTLLETSRNETINATHESEFADTLIAALADSSIGGEFISREELDALLIRPMSPCLEACTVRFTEIWNSSLTFWEQGIFTASDLPPTFSGSFFDLHRAESTKTGFFLARNRILTENFAGLGDAWLTAVEAQQSEESKQLAGVCASVRVQIEQEFTLTRTGFECRLELLNSGDFPLENVTGEINRQAHDSAHSV